MRNLSNDMQNQAILWSQLAHSCTDSGARRMCLALASAHMDAADRTFLETTCTESSLEITDADRAWFRRPL